MLLLLLKRGIFPRVSWQCYCGCSDWALKNWKIQDKIQNTYSQYMNAFSFQYDVYTMGNVCFSSCKTYHARNMHYACAFLYARKHHIFSTEFFLFPAFFTCSILLFNELNKTTKTVDDIQNFCRLFVFTLYFSSHWNVIVAFYSFAFRVVSLHLDLAFVHCQRGNDEGS